MPITEDSVGRSYPATAPYRVSEAKIAEFAAALGDDNPAYRGPDAVAPPTFAAVISAQSWGALFGDPDLGLALHRTIHGDQSFEFARPLRVDHQVRATLTVTGYRSRGSTDMIKIEVALDTVDGERVCTAASQFIHTREESA